MTQAQSVSPAPELRLVAPVDGVVVPLEDLPDAVFAEKMLGDGISIDPTKGRVLAPCSGVVSTLHRARHALTIKTDEGPSILVHVGLDTVTLNGEGFTALVAEGDRLEAGTPIIEFDLDTIARKALSAQVELVITEGGENVSFKLESGRVRAGEDTVLRISMSPPSGARPAGGAPEENAALGQSPGGALVQRSARIENPHGMHARPAARIGQVAKRFDAKVTLTFGGKSASATSVTDIMSLELEKGSVITIRAEGRDAERAASALCDAISEGLGEDLRETAKPETKTKFITNDEAVLGGIPASPGLSIGTVVTRRTELPAFETKSSDPSAQVESLDRALSEVRQKLTAQEQAFLEAGDKEKAQIFAAHRELLDDEGLHRKAREGIDGGNSAAAAWMETIRLRIEQFGALKSPLLRERASDLSDVGRRVLYAIVGQDEPKLVLSTDSVLCCSDLTPSLAASLDPKNIRAIVTELGGATSHAAIIARSMGVPYVAGVGPDIEKLADGLRVIVDGSTGSIAMDPDEGAIDRAEREIERLENVRAGDMKRAHEKAVTLDGFEVEVAANIGSSRDAKSCVQNGGDGVGLLRSEFLFLGRREAPSEDEQRQEYEEIAKTLGPTRSLVLRTLDVGGDKPLSYMPLEEEENPFLGIRGLRLSLKYPDLFRAQIRAALCATEHTKLNLMFPMVSSPLEFSRARRLVESEMLSLGVDAENVAIGVMVEVPSAALNARWLAEEADFFSIGTNDLTQYTLAMDRGHSELSKQADAFDPAVLRLIQMTVEAAHAKGKWVGVCGGLAAEPLATPLLIGLDINELSVPAPVIAELKSRIRRLEHEECRAVAEGALALPGPEHVRRLLASFSSGT